MKPIKFKPMPTQKARIFLTTDVESLTNFYALIHTVDLLNKRDGRYDISLTFNTPSLVTLANQVGWLGFKAESRSNVGNTRVISLSPSAEKVAFWEKEDREGEFNYRTEKYSHVDPEKLAVPEVRYNNYIKVLRDALDLFDIELEHPLAILNEARNVKYINSKALRNSGWNLLSRHQIKSGAFTLAESGFAKWTGESTSEVWGRVITLPNPEALLADEKSLLEYVGALTSPHCAGIGLVSTDYVALGVSAHLQSASVIWDLRPSFGIKGEDAEMRLLSSLLIPDSKSVFAPNMDPENVPSEAITRELAYALSSYYTTLKKVISQGKARFHMDRPGTPSSFEWSLA